MIRYWFFAMISENTMSPKLFEKILSISVADVCVIWIGHVMLGNKELAVSMSKKFAYIILSLISID